MKPSNYQEGTCDDNRPPFLLQFRNKKYIEILGPKSSNNNSLYNNIYIYPYIQTCNYICEYLECHLFQKHA